MDGEFISIKLRVYCVKLSWLKMQMHPRPSDHKLTTHHTPWTGIAWVLISPLQTQSNNLDLTRWRGIFHLICTAHSSSHDTHASSSTLHPSYAILGKHGNARRHRGAPPSQGTTPTCNRAPARSQKCVMM
jgi:hypothetical protein